MAFSLKSAAAAPAACAAGGRRAQPATIKQATRKPTACAPKLQRADRPSRGRVALQAKLAEGGKPKDKAQAQAAPEAAPEWVDRFAGGIRKGSDILVQALEREGVDTVFAYPGGASMEIHQALTRSTTVRNILCRHEQGEIFAAEGYAKSTGRVGVCIATSGPGATNLVTGLADAMLDSVPLVAITGQVPRRLIGTDAFQETPIVEVTRQITKHNFLVMDLQDLPRILREAFFLARSGRPGPVLVDVPKDIQQMLGTPDWDQPLSIQGYIGRLPPAPEPAQLQPVLRALREAKKPVAYVGGGCNDAAPEVREFLERSGIPVATTLMGLGVVAGDHPQAMAMLGMHGTVYANYSVDQADLLIALGVRFDDRVTGKLESFATHARIVHIDVDPAEIHKNKHAHVPLCSDVKPALRILNRLLAAEPLDPAAYAPWRAELAAKKAEFPMAYPQRDDCIVPQHAIQVLHEETKGEAIIATGVGQHQMWAAQWYNYSQPRRWISSGGLGSMGFGLPSALGAAAAHDGKNGRPKRVVVDIDGDGSFVMNIQELATAYVEQLEAKVMILNNQHLGMVVQWEDRFYKANRAHTYLGKPEAEWHVTKDLADIYPDFVGISKAFGVPARRVVDKAELRAAIREMLDTPGPYLLDVMVPHMEHVLPMIPGGGSFKDIITEGDGRRSY